MKKLTMKVLEVEDTDLVGPDCTGRILDRIPSIKLETDHHLIIYRGMVLKNVNGKIFKGAK